MDTRIWNKPHSIGFSGDFTLEARIIFLSYQLYNHPKPYYGN
jgi:hypothetical protein